MSRTRINRDLKDILPQGIVKDTCKLWAQKSKAAENPAGVTAGGLRPLPPTFSPESATDIYFYLMKVFTTIFPALHTLGVSYFIVLWYECVKMWRSKQTCRIKCSNCQRATGGRQRSIWECSGNSGKCVGQKICLEWGFWQAANRYCPSASCETLPSWGNISAATGLLCVIGHY